MKSLFSLSSGSVGPVSGPRNPDRSGPPPKTLNADRPEPIRGNPRLRTASCPSRLTRLEKPSPDTAPDGKSRILDGLQLHLLAPSCTNLRLKNFSGITPGYPNLSEASRSVAVGRFRSLPSHSTPIFTILLFCQKITHGLMQPGRTIMLLVWGY